MPKTSMNKNDLAAGGENKVRLSRKIGPVQTKAKSELMDKRTDQ
jgi:hypothetical protein